MLAWTSQNRTLIKALYTTVEDDNLRQGWRALTDGCRVEPLGCWCFHVAGSMVKAKNPHGAKQCAPKDKLLDCTNPANGPFFIKARRNCSCFAQAPSPAPPCLFGDMRPAKLLAIISACRALGVTHIIEQGRFGGLSAWIYSLHGFKVSSVELLPLREVSEALRTRAPEIALIDADGREAVQRLVRDAPASERIAVIFDGEKRQTAYTTFGMVKPKIVLAAFDDTNLDNGVFPQLLRSNREDAWHTWECDYMRMHSDASPLALLGATLRAASAPHLQRVGEVGAERLRRQGQVDAHERLIFHGGMEDLARFHTSLVLGGASSVDP